MLSREKLLSLVTNAALELIILPTEQCNFRCIYCYEDFSKGRMKPETVEAIKKLITKRAVDLQKLKISWFGGEPLAAKEIIYDIHQHVHQIVKNYPNLQIFSDITTNGYHLNQQTFERLINHGVNHFQISLDGTKNYHDLTRRRMDGAGTFDKIWHNLTEMQKTDHHFSVKLRLHVLPNNTDDMYQLLDKIKSQFGWDQRFSILLKAIENLGGPNSDNLVVLNKKDKIDYIKNMYDYIGKPLKREETYVCYAAMTNSFVIRADSSIGKCTVALQDDRNKIGELDRDGNLLIVREKIKPWTRGIYTQDLNALRCPMTQLSTTPVIPENM